MYNKRILIYTPDKHINLLASEVFMEAYEDAEDILFDEEELLNFLILQNIWNDEDEENYKKTLPKHIEYWKIELYKNVLKTNTRNEIRKYLSAAKKEYLRLHKTRNMYAHMTIDGYAAYVKNMFIVYECAKIDNKKIDWSKFDINHIMNQYYSSLLSSEKIRILSRTTPWINMWPSLQKNGRIFDDVNLSQEQYSLISWSNMYDRIRESPECPTEEVINDDDMLDGWILLQSEKNRKEKQQHEITSNSKINNADEVFLVAQTKEDAQKIDELNSNYTRKIKKDRMSKVNKQGKVKQQEFNDIKQKFRMQMQQAFSQQMKGRKNG